jgi:hypothetical protein
MRRLAALIAALALVLLAAAPAQAASTSRKDKDDTLGPLDLKKVSLAVKGKKMTITVATHDAFADEDLSGASAIGVDFQIGKDVSRGIAIKSPREGGLTADICTYRTGGDLLGTKCSPVKAKRLSDTTVQLKVSRAKIDKGARSYRWNAGSLTSTYGGDCSNITPRCIDRLPDRDNSWITWKP